MTGRRLLPPPGDAAPIASVLVAHPRWSVFWDKRSGVWRVAEDNPDSDLYAEASSATEVIGYITEHAHDASGPADRPAGSRPEA